MANDVEVTNCGTIVLFWPKTSAAKAVFDEDLDTQDWQWLGPRLAVDHCMAEGVMAFLEQQGLSLLLN